MPSATPRPGTSPAGATRILPALARAAPPVRLQAPPPRIRQPWPKAPCEASPEARLISCLTCNTPLHHAAVGVSLVEVTGERRHGRRDRGAVCEAHRRPEEGRAGQASGGTPCLRGAAGARA